VHSTKANIGKEIINGLVVFHIREANYILQQIGRKKIDKGSESG